MRSYKNKTYFIYRDKYGIFASSSHYGYFGMKIRGLERIGEVELQIPRFELGDEENLEMQREKIALQQWLKNLGMGSK
jgi:hypothetical protein